MPSGTWDLQGSRFHVVWQDKSLVVLSLAITYSVDQNLAKAFVMHPVIKYLLSGRDAFALLAQASLIPPELAKSLQKMVGFRNLAVHAYQEISLPILQAILEQRLEDLHAFARLLVKVGN